VGVLAVITLAEVFERQLPVGLRRVLLPAATFSCAVPYSAQTVFQLLTNASKSGGSCRAKLTQMNPSAVRT
jgi:hypothetical protein